MIKIVTGFLLLNLVVFGGLNFVSASSHLTDLPKEVADLIAREGLVFEGVDADIEIYKSSDGLREFYFYRNQTKYFLIDKTAAPRVSVYFDSSAVQSDFFDLAKQIRKIIADQAAYFDVPAEELPPFDVYIKNKTVPSQISHFSTKLRSIFLYSEDLKKIPWALSEEISHCLATAVAGRPPYYLGEAVPAAVCGLERKTLPASGILKAKNEIIKIISQTKRKKALLTGYLNILLSIDKFKDHHLDKSGYAIADLFSEYFLKKLGRPKALLDLLKDMSLSLNVTPEEFVNALNKIAGTNYTVNGFLADFRKFILNESRTKLQIAVQQIGKQLARQRTLYQPVTYTLKFGGVPLKVVGGSAGVGQIIYEFTVFDETAQKELSSFSIIRAPDQMMELLDFPIQQVDELKEFAEYSPLRELSKSLQESLSQQQGDLTKKKIELSKQINYLEECLKFKGTEQVCVLENKLSSRLFDLIIKGIFASKDKILPAKEVLYLSKPGDVIKIKDRLEALWEEKEIIERRAQRNYERYRLEKKKESEREFQLRQEF